MLILRVVPRIGRLRFVNGLRSSIAVAAAPDATLRYIDGELAPFACMTREDRVRFKSGFLTICAMCRAATGPMIGDATSAGK